MKEFFKRFIAVDNTVNENTVIGICGVACFIGFGIAACFTALALPPMFASLALVGACFTLNLKYK